MSEFGPDIDGDAEVIFEHKTELEMHKNNAAHYREAYLKLKEHCDFLQERLREKDRRLSALEGNPQGAVTWLENTITEETT